MSAGGVRALLWSVLLCSLIILIITVTMAQSVPCWSVPNGVNNTIQCANGYWQTITPEGEVHSGNGMTDPSAGAAGSTIVINPATGGPSGGVTPPTQQLPPLAPHEAGRSGFNRASTRSRMPLCGSASSVPFMRRSGVLQIPGPLSYAPSSR